MLFEKVTPAPPDSILGLTEAFKKDAHPRKMNLGVGVFVDEAGRTPILKSVKLAEQLMVANEETKTYLPISGSSDYAKYVQNLMFGKDEPRSRTANTPGGTGALRVGAEFLKKILPSATLWVSRPTWPNHLGVFSSAGFAVKEYPYYDPATHGLDFNRMIEALDKVPANDVVLLHVCCHNPTGVDVGRDQWRPLADVAKKRGWIPFFDFAYQGFGDSLEEDRSGLIPFMELGLEGLISSSYSKNFGLYNERVGALTVVAAQPAAAETAFSQVKAVVRTIYSNPPSHGSQIVSTILQNTELRALWESEVRGMRERIAGTRVAMVEGLKQRNAPMDFSFIMKQKGMFSFSGLSDAQVAFLRGKKGIYMVGGGRINVAGIMPRDMDYLCDSMIEALKA